MEQIGFTEENLEEARRICRYWQESFEAGTAATTTTFECLGENLAGVDIVNMGPHSVARALNRGYEPKGINRASANGKGGMQLIMIKPDVEQPKLELEVIENPEPLDVSEPLEVPQLALTG